MPTVTMTGPEGLPKFAEECAKVLLSDPQHQFQYPKSCSLQHWPIDEIKAANDELLKTLRHRANVYAIFVCDPARKEAWHPVYVGERKSGGLRDRITQHLVAKDPRTGSMLEAIQTAVSSGKEIGLSFLKVQPESLRLYVEEAIISRNKENLPWNKHG